MQQTKRRCENFKLVRSSNVANDLKVFPSSGVIKVKEKSFKILRTRGDGNCQFRALSILVTGADKEVNHKMLRNLAVKEFMKIEDCELKNSLCFTHDPRDCITTKRCRERKMHEGACLQASTPPFRRSVLNKEEFAQEMSKDKTWGNEYTLKSLALAMDLKINVFQQDEGTQSFRVLTYNSVSVRQPLNRVNICNLGSKHPRRLKFEISAYFNQTKRNLKKKKLTPDPPIACYMCIYQ